jgi:hypothetical protein
LAFSYGCEGPLSQPLSPPGPDNNAQLVGDSYPDKEANDFLVSGRVLRKGESNPLPVFEKLDVKQYFEIDNLRTVFWITVLEIGY